MKRVFLAAIPLAAALALQACSQGSSSPIPLTPPAASHDLQDVLHVDNVALKLPGVYAHGIIMESQPGDATQESSVVDQANDRTFTVISAPYGTRPFTEAVPLSQPGAAQAYRSALYAYRQSHGENPVAAAQIRVFGEMTPGIHSVQTQTLQSVKQHRTIEQDVITDEWVTEAGGRTWIVRTTQTAPHASVTAMSTQYARVIGALTVDAHGPMNAPSSIQPDRAGSAPPAGLPPLQPARRTMNLPRVVPPNYSDSCNKTNYDNATNYYNWRNYLGTYYQGVPACGPRPAYGGTDVAWTFYNGDFGVYDFECVELSMRWMYLAYGTPTYPANGNQVFANYNYRNGGQRLYKVDNTPGPPYVPVGGDVLSYTNGTNGHTSVVMDSSIDGNGNGYADVIEENASYYGTSRLTISDYQILSNYGGSIVGFLTPRPIGY